MSANIIPFKPEKLEKEKDNLLPIIDSADDYLIGLNWKREKDVTDPEILHQLASTNMKLIKLLEHWNTISVSEKEKWWAYLDTVKQIFRTRMWAEAIIDLRKDEQNTIELGDMFWRSRRKVLSILNQDRKNEWLFPIWVQKSDDYYLANVD